jgi:hypothetical protein
MVELTGKGTSKRAKWCWRWCRCGCGCIDGADVLIKIGARFAPNVPRAQKSFWLHSMDLLGDVGQMESCFGPFGDSVNLHAR